jgi:hypothetical protein
VRHVVFSGRDATERGRAVAELGRRRVESAAAARRPSA